MQSDYRIQSVVGLTVFDLAGTKRDICFDRQVILRPKNVLFIIGCHLVAAIDTYSFHDSVANGNAGEDFLYF